MTVNGPRALAILASEFRALGYRDLKLQLARGTRKAGKPLMEQARANARDRLPKGGGLNELVANEKIAVRNRLTGQLHRHLDPHELAAAEPDQRRLRAAPDVFARI
jgi:hypothetical protein